MDCLTTVFSPIKKVFFISKNRINTLTAQWKPLNKKERLICAISGIGGVAFISLGMLKADSLKNRTFDLYAAGSAVVLYGMRFCLRALYSIKRQESNDQKEQAKICNEAMAFAEEQLIQHKDTKPYTVGGEVVLLKQPCDRRINLLMAIYDPFYKSFTEELKKIRDNPWEEPSVIQAADKVMKLGYALSRLTLEDLPEFHKNLNDKERGRSLEYTLKCQGNYFFILYYRFTIYNNLRFGAKWVEGKGPQKSILTKDGWVKVPREGLEISGEITKEYESSFYKKGTLQNNWRLLNNDFSDRVFTVVDKKRLLKEDERLANCLTKDLHPETFKTSNDKPSI